MHSLFCGIFQNARFYGTISVFRWGGEMADAPALGAGAARHVGSSPTPSTPLVKSSGEALLFRTFTVEFFVHFTELFVREVGVDLRGRDVRMAEELLH